MTGEPMTQEDADAVLELGQGILNVLEPVVEAFGSWVREFGAVVRRLDFERRVRADVGAYTVMYARDGRHLYQAHPIMAACRICRQGPEHEAHIPASEFFATWRTYAHPMVISVDGGRVIDPPSPAAGKDAWTPGRSKSCCSHCRSQYDGGTAAEAVEHTSCWEALVIEQHEAAKVRNDGIVDPSFMFE